MTKSDGYKRLVLVAAPFIFAAGAWVFTAVIWGGQKDNRVEIAKVEDKCDERSEANEKVHNSMDARLTKQLYTLDSNVGKLQVGQTNIKEDIAEIKADIKEIRKLLEERP